MMIKNHFRISLGDNSHIIWKMFKNALYILIGDALSNTSAIVVARGEINFRWFTFQHNWRSKLYKATSKV